MKKLIGFLVAFFIFGAISTFALSEDQHEDAIIIKLNDNTWTTEEMDGWSTDKIALKGTDKWQDNSGVPKKVGEGLGATNIRNGYIDSLGTWGHDPETGNYGGRNLKNGDFLSGINTFRTIVDGTDCIDATAAIEIYTKNRDGNYIKYVTVRHLDGIADDSFNVYLSYGGKPANDVLRDLYNPILKAMKIGTYTADASTTENWKTTTFTVPQPVLRQMQNWESWRATLIFEATGTDVPWSGCATYGQIAVSAIALE